MNAESIWKTEAEGRYFTKVEVTEILAGMTLSLGLHVVRGRKKGPTLGIIGGVHGDETLPPMAFREILEMLDPAKMSGQVAVIPVCNPLSMELFNRQTPEQHGNTDLHTVFPGNAQTGNLTQKMAIAIRENLIDHVDAFIDFHSGGSGGRLQYRADFDDNAEPNVREKCIALCRAFGAPFIHANNLAKTASSYANSKGIPTCNPEVGGSYLSSEHTQLYMKHMVDGLKRVMAHLGMLPFAPESENSRQILFNVKSRVEVNLCVGGFLESQYQSPADLGKPIAKGAPLGRVIDMHRLDVAEELVAPVDGYLFFSRYSGVVEAGTKAFAIAEEKGSEWLG